MLLTNGALRPSTECSITCLNRRLVPHPRAPRRLVHATTARGSGEERDSSRQTHPAAHLALSTAAALLLASPALALDTQALGRQSQSYRDEIEGIIERRKALPDLQSSPAGPAPSPTQPAPLELKGPVPETRLDIPSRVPKPLPVPPDFVAPKVQIFSAGLPAPPPSESGKAPRAPKKKKEPQQPAPPVVAASQESQPAPSVLAAPQGAGGSETTSAPALPAGGPAAAPAAKQDTSGPAAATPAVVGSPGDDLKAAGAPDVPKAVPPPQPETQLPPAARQDSASPLPGPPPTLPGAKVVVPESKFDTNEPLLPDPRDEAKDRAADAAKSSEVDQQPANPFAGLFEARPAAAPEGGGTGSGEDPVQDLKDSPLSALFPQANAADAVKETAEKVGPSEPGSSIQDALGGAAEAARRVLGGGPASQEEDSKPQEAAPSSPGSMLSSFFGDGGGSGSGEASGAAAAGKVEAAGEAAAQPLEQAKGAAESTAEGAKEAASGAQSSASRAAVRAVEPALSKEDAKGILEGFRKS